mmetsp:Transcript_54290/g.117455  ORF Transcript_54290/g.117455 Transcript_54290/m.117455 type:complete len:171 (+) Transcript_54290:102-614(+)
MPFLLSFTGPLSLGRLPALVALAWLATGAAAEAGDVSAIQTSYTVKRIHPDAVGQAAVTKATSGVRSKDDLRLRLAHLEGLSSKQHKKLDGLRRELTGRGDSGVDAGRRGSEHERVEMLEKGIRERAAMIQELRTGAEAALERGNAKVAAAVKSCEDSTPCECPEGTGSP